MKITWIDGKREPKEQPDPHYPNGIDLDLTRGKRPSCETKLPYPAKRCGHYLVVCEKCAQKIIVTTAGRPDDPRSVRIRCLFMGQHNDSTS
jgi:hypothetical protein